MRRHAYLVRIQNFTDIVTNSSSEIFCTNSDKPLEVIREILNNVKENYHVWGSTVTTIKDYFFEDVDVDLETMEKEKIDISRYNFSRFSYKGVCFFDLHDDFEVPIPKLYDIWKKSWKEDSGLEVTDDTIIINIDNNSSNTIRFIENNLNGVRINRDSLENY